VSDVLANKKQTNPRSQKIDMIHLATRQRRNQYILGLFFIVTVAIIWAASSVLIQFIYESDSFDFHSPFLVTYIGVSLFSLWLPVHKITTTACFFPSKSNSVQYQHIPLHQLQAEEEEDDDAEYVCNNDPDEEQTSNGFPVMLHPTNSTSTTTTTLAVVTSTSGTIVPPPSHNFELVRKWDDMDHFRAACWIAPVWFIANWAYNASLAYTSVTSSTVLASTSSLFTFLFAVACKDEHFNYIKLAGILMGVTGSIITTLNDVNGDGEDDPTNTTSRTGRMMMLARRWLVDDDSSPHKVLGDMLGLISALGYAMYAVQTRVLCPHDENLYSMQLLLGYVGLLNMVILSPVAAFQILSGRTELVWIVVGVLVLKGLFDNVLSDYLWLRAVILTNATVATVGLGITIPLAFFSDVMKGKSEVLGIEEVIGAILVLVGFALVNIGNDDESSSSGANPLDDSIRGQEIVVLE
jgi:solute carrier family 35 protein F5